MVIALYYRMLRKMQDQMRMSMDRQREADGERRELGLHSVLLHDLAVHAAFGGHSSISDHLLCSRHAPEVVIRIWMGMVADRN